MDHPPPPQITSFILRFVYADPPAQEGSPVTQSGQPVGIRGVIRNIQTDQEVIFTRWQDAVDFIQQFVPLQFEG